MTRALARVDGLVIVNLIKQMGGKILG